MSATYSFERSMATVTQFEAVRMNETAAAGRRRRPAAVARSCQRSLGRNLAECRVQVDALTGAVPLGDEEEHEWDRELEARGDQALLGVEVQPAHRKHEV